MSRELLAESWAHQPEGASGVEDLLSITQIANARGVCAQENLVTGAADHLRSAKANTA
jgi:hypothetical protein